MLYAAFPPHKKGKMPPKQAAMARQPIPRPPRSSKHTAGAFGSGSPPTCVEQFMAARARRAKKGKGEEVEVGEKDGPSLFFCFSSFRVLPLSLSICVCASPTWYV